MATQHTPGPWQVAGARHSGDLKIGQNTRLHMVGPDNDAVAAVFFDMRTGRGFSDARLIAAAPELLEVAQRILDRGYVSACIDEERADHQALVAAIAKATGAA